MSVDSLVVMTVVTDGIRAGGGSGSVSVRDRWTVMLWLCPVTMLVKSGSAHSLVDIVWSAVVAGLVCVWDSPSCGCLAEVDEVSVTGSAGESAVLELSEVMAVVCTVETSVSLLVLTVGTKCASVYSVELVWALCEVVDCVPSDVPDGVDPVEGVCVPSDK